MTDTTASRCLDLIARHAPKLMLQGGGRIESDRQTNKLSRATVKKILALREKGLTLEAISKAVGFSKSAVQVHCSLHKKNGHISNNAEHQVHDGKALSPLCQPEVS